MTENEFYEGEDLEEDYEKEIEDEIEDDEISDAEAEFKEGYENNYLTKCRNCNKDLENTSKIIEEEIDGEVKRFCSEKCRDDFVKINIDNEEYYEDEE
jgi:ribosomal protein L24E